MADADLLARAPSRPSNLDPTRSFQGLILALQQYWADWGCVILQPYDMEVGAGTFHPATTLRALGPKPWNAAYVQPSRRQEQASIRVDHLGFGPRGYTNALCLLRRGRSWQDRLSRTSSRR